MKQLLWKEWRKTRAVFFLFCALNLLAIAISYVKTDLVATLIYVLTSVFLSLLLPAIVFNGDYEQNSGNFTEALPISRKFMWFSRLFYIALISLVFHGLFHLYAFHLFRFDLKIYILLFALTITAVLNAHIFENSLVTALSSAIVFCTGTAILSLMLYSFYFLFIPTVVICVIATTLLLLLKKETPITNVLAGLLIIVEVFFIYYNYKMGKVDPSYQSLLLKVLSKNIIAVVIFLGMGICGTIMSYQLFVCRKSAKKISLLFLSIATLIVSTFSLFNNTQYETGYVHMSKDTFVHQKYYNNKWRGLDIKTFDYTSKKMQETNLYFGQYFYDHEREGSYLLGYNIEHSWGIPFLKKNYIYSCTNEKKYNMPLNPSIYEYFFCRGNYLFFLGEKQFDIVEVKDKLRNHIVYQIDEYSNFVGTYNNHAYFLDSKNKHLIKLGINQKERQIDRSVKRIFSEQSDSSLFDLTARIMENRFLLLEKRLFDDVAHCEFWVRDLRNDTLKKLYNIKENDVFARILKMNVVTNQCIISYDKQVIFIDLESGKTRKLTGRFIDADDKYFLLKVGNIIQQREYSTYKIANQQQFDPARRVTWKRKNYIFLGYSKEGKFYYFDIKKQKFHDKKLPGDAWVDYIDEHQGVFYTDGDKKFYYSDRSDNSVVVY